MKITNDFAGIGDDLIKSLEPDMKEVLIIGSESAVNASPVATGRFKANWHVSTNEPSFSSFKSEDIDGASTLNSMFGAIKNIDLSNTSNIFIQNNAESDEGEFYAATVRYDYTQSSANFLLQEIEEKIDSAIT